ncbi:putative integral membrane protein [Bhargavaea cecembensis DSE10]|uniref:Putative integral membrane protein n=1 Tax=Bhargavaea cecembensis DSE10 TaxID=1235279 RepID=M7PBR9_9BACL|nr:VanZ family protein [Bhargavaea cecembensis]EMR07924.1 putative integral membrane protein [Bhargavaea cecembensis DSE10]
MKKYLFLLLIIALLFFSSGQTYEQQSLIPKLKEWLPGQPLEGVLSTLQVPYWGRTISVESKGYYHFIEFLIRKGAHIVSFGVLAAAIFAVLPKIRFRYLAAFGLTVIAAFMDEYHQSLTGGRTPYLGDVALDAFGAALFLSLIALLMKRNVPKRKTAGIS